MKINKKELKFYLFIILVCVLVSMVVVLVTDFIPQSVPKILDRIEDDYIRETAEKATGKKIDDIALERIKKKYKNNQEKKR